VLAKCDTIRDIEISQLAAGPERIAVTSAKNGEVSDLLGKLRDTLHTKQMEEVAALATVRQATCLQRAEDSIREAELMARGKREAAADDLVASELKQAVAALGEITGESVTVDIISEVFSRFCLGK
jgi:tRNA modification GTPase